MRLFKPNIKKLKSRKNTGALITALNDKDEQVRRDAAEVLGTLKDHAAVEALVNVLEDKEAGIPIAAIKAIAEIGDTTALRNALKHRLPHVRWHAAKALNDMEIVDSAIIEVLIEELTEDVFREDRWDAAEALRRIGNPAIEPLTEKLVAVCKATEGSYVDPWECEYRLAEILGDIGGSKAVEPILHISADTGAIKIVLEKIKTQEFDKSLNFMELTLKGDLDALSSIITEKYIDARIRKRAVKAVASIGGARAIRLVAN
jgi:HEAT repeat protein